MTIPQLLASVELRRPLMTVVFAMISQQISGINAGRRLSFCIVAPLNVPVLYYSNDILSKSIPELASYVSLVITIVNFFMTFPPIFLIEASVVVFKSLQWLNEYLACWQETTYPIISCWRYHVSPRHWLWAE